MRILPNVPPVAAALLIATLSGCASKKPEPAPSPSVTSGTGAPAAGDSASPVAPAVIRGTSRPSDAAPRRDRQMLTRDEIRSTQFTNAYDVIQSLRGNWLRSRSAESFGTSSTVQVYLDQQRLSGVAELRSMSPLNIESIRFMDPLQASGRYGMDHGAGAIIVTTAKR